MTAPALPLARTQSEPDPGAPAGVVTRLGYAALVALAYIPLLLTSPGKVVADTKSYLYLDPGRLLERAPYMWTPNIANGTLTHQQIGYLWPLGPYYWLTHTLGMPAWIAQRLWLGSILLLAALGVRYLLRTLHVQGPGVPVAMVLFMLSPYVLNFADRSSVLLLPMAGLPWILGLTIRALRDGDGRGWRYPAIFALVAVTVGSVNFSALLFVGVAPILWIVYDVTITRNTPWRRGLAVALKIGLLTFLVSLWWIVGLVLENGYGTNLLLFTETFKTVALLSSVPEVLRGLGYWLFYGRDKLGPLSDASVEFQTNVVVIAISFLVPIVALCSAAWVRWRHRAFFVLLAVVGVMIAVSAHPYDDPSLLGSIWKSVVAESGFGLAVRNTPRVGPLIVLSFAVLVGMAVNAAALHWNARGVRTRGLVLAGVIVVLAVANIPSLFDGSIYSQSLLRDENVPKYWTDAIAALDAQPHDTRILEIPGADFVYYRWGTTLDPITPFLTDRPYVAREQVAFGSESSVDLLRAFDDKLQEGVLEPESIAPIARLMSVGDVVYRADLQTDRYDLAPAKPTWYFLTQPTVPPGLAAPTGFGDSLGPPLAFPKENEVVLALPPGTKDPPPVSIFHVADAPSIVRTASSSGALVVSGDGSGLVDLAIIGGLDDNARAVLYSASYAKNQAALQQVATSPDAVLVVTDSNRKRAERWGTINSKVGATERIGEQNLTTDETDQRLEVFPGQGASAQTVIRSPGARATASRYGGDFILEPELRAQRAFDGDLSTSWQVGFHSQVIGDRIRLDLDQPITTDQVHLVQPIVGAVDRFITRVTLTFDGKHPQTVDLTDASRTADGQTITFPKQSFRRFEVRIDDTNVGNDVVGQYTNNVGFAEIGLHDEAPGAAAVRVDELVRMPTDLVDAVGSASSSHALVYSMSRSRTNVIPPKFSQDELALVRELRVPDTRLFSARGGARLATDAPDDVLDELFGIPDASHGGLTVRASEHLPGSVAARGSAAFDGDPSTSWSTGFFTPVGQWVEFVNPAPVTLSHLDLQVVADGRHSVPTQLRIDAGADSRTVDLPPITDQAGENATVTVPVDFAPMTTAGARVTISAIRPVLSHDYYCECDTPAPVAIAEVGAAGVRRPAMPAELPAVCRTDIASVDGSAMGVRLVGTTTDAENRRVVDLQPCDPAGTTSPLRLTAGDHVIRTAEGKATGVDVDRFVLGSAPDGTAMTLGRGGSVATGLQRAAPVAATSTPQVRVTSSSDTKLELRVDGAQPGTPFWLVLGESKNRGWKATVDGADMPSSSLVNGFANGWLVNPRHSSFSVSLEWTPQKVVWIGLAVSLVAAIWCLFLALRRARRRPAVPDLDGTVALANPLVADGAAPSRRVVVAAPLIVAVFAAFATRWWIGLVAGAAVLAVLLRPRLRGLLTIGAPIALGLTAAYVVLQQVRHDYAAEFVWPQHFDPVNDLAWLAVILLASDAVVELLRTRPWQRQGDDPARLRPPGSDGQEAESSP